VPEVLTPEVLGRRARPTLGPAFRAPRGRILVV